MAAKATKRSEVPHYDAQAFAFNLTRIVEHSQRLVQEFLARQLSDPNSGMGDPRAVGGAFLEMFTQLLGDPSKLIENQFDLWQEHLALWESAALRFWGVDAEPVAEPDSRDRRFKDAAWEESAIFDFIKQSYLLTARWLQKSVHEVEGLDGHTAQKLDFYTRQFVDAMSPSNFLFTNPEVLRATLESGGENLVKGLENLLQDLERGKGKLAVRMTDLDAFAVGRNLALSPGKVVHQNDLMQLIQYSPTTEQVYQRPLLLIPAWINKFYILDLQPENSMVRWYVERGYTVFVISWINPDERHAAKTFDDYLTEGPLAALDAIEKATGEKEITALGYCLGGTLLAITQAWLQAHGKADRIKAVTYLTTMVDFSEAGELSVFIDEEQLALLEERMNDTGYLDGTDMAMTFNMLRANDLIWSFVVNNYLLGKEPFPFDLLYWNSDSTRMPARMHSFYLRNMYQNNLLATPGGIVAGGTPIDLRTVAIPTYLLSTREDHIAPWKATYKATQIYTGPVRFVLSASGHIAGAVNPPSKNKYCFWTNDQLPADPEKWLAGAKETQGSWWPDWDAWNAKHSGPKVKARIPGEGKLKAIEDAPGSYVKAQG